MSFIYSKLCSLFKEGKLRSNSECANGDLFSGQPVQWSKNSDIPSVEITDSPGSLQRKTYISISMGSISGMSEDSHSLDENDGQASSSGSPKRETRSQISESPENSIVSPSRKSMAVLKKVLNVGCTKCCELVSVDLWLLCHEAVMYENLMGEGSIEGQRWET